MQILLDDCFIGERQDENLLPAHPESALLTMEKMKKKWRARFRKTKKEKNRVGDW